MRFAQAVVWLVSYNPEHYMLLMGLFMNGHLLYRREKISRFYSEIHVVTGWVFFVLVLAFLERDHRLFMFMIVVMFGDQTKNIRLSMCMYAFLEAKEYLGITSRVRVAYTLIGLVQTNILRERERVQVGCLVLIHFETKL